MKNTGINVILTIFLILFSRNIMADSLKVVPIPMEVKEGKGSFLITKTTRVLIDNNDAVRKIAELFVQKIVYSSGIKLNIGVVKKESKFLNTIVFSTLGAEPALGKEGYTINVSKSNVTICAVAPNGLFYALQTIFQLLPADVEKAATRSISYRLPVVKITDKPRFDYRGLHLDVGRHMFPVEFIKKYIDLMAMYKLNTFHWHLTEDQGWRIEIKKYPRLTQIGSIRKGSQVGKTDENDGVPYGGFYTQDEAREVVAYAASKFITVIPEIEMPGHSVAALTAYPSLACTVGPFEVRTKWGVADDILCAGNDSVFIFMQDVLTEIMDIFPSTYIHIGGDEAPKTRWKSCPKCQARIKAEGLKDEAELQSYFIKRIEKFLVSKNRRLIGWDEILEGGLAPESTVMAWRGIQAAIDAAAQGHDAIMTPVDYCYLDYYQSDPSTEPEAIGGYLTLKTVYSYDPVPPKLTAEQAKHIVGVQGNLWTEYIKTSDMAEYMAFPRAIAIAEIGWSSQQNRNWDDFISRMDNQFTRLDNLKVNYCKGTLDVEMTTLCKNNRNQIVISNETKGFETRYTTDGSDPVPTSSLFTKPVEIAATSVIKAALFRNGVRAGRIHLQEFVVDKASGKPVTIIKPYSFKYPGTGPQAMTDGICGGLSYKSGWQGYEGTDMGFTVDLLAPVQISSIKMHFASSPSDWVLLPTEILYSMSYDGITWKNLEPLHFDSNAKSSKEIFTAESKFDPANVRFIKAIAISPKILPAWHEYKGEKCWIFADELIAE